MNKTVSNNAKPRLMYLVGGGIVVIAAITAITLAVIASKAKDSEPSLTRTILPVAAEDLVASPHDYRGAPITFTGRIFAAEGSAGEQVLQIYSDVDNSDGNIIVYNYSSVEYDEDDYVTVKGKVADANEGENAFGAKLTVPVVVADSIEKRNADDAIAPATYTAKPNDTKTAGGLSVTLKKVEYATEETRLSLVFDNKSNVDYNFYSFDSTLIQSRKSFKEKSVYVRDNGDFNNTISAGTIENITLYYNPIKPGVNAVFTAQVTDNSSYNDSKLQFTFQ